MSLVESEQDDQQCVLKLTALQQEVARAWEDPHCNKEAAKVGVEEEKKPRLQYTRCDVAHA